MIWKNISFIQWVKIIKGRNDLTNFPLNIRQPGYTVDIILKCDIKEFGEVYLQQVFESS